MKGSLWESRDGTVFYVVELCGTHVWNVIDLKLGVLDQLWLGNGASMRRIDTYEWLKEVKL